MDGGDNYHWEQEASFTRLLTNNQYGEETSLSNFASYEASRSHMINVPHDIQSMGSYEASGSHMVGVPHLMHSAGITSHQRRNDDTTDDNIHIDDFGIDHEDDIDNSSEDEGVNEVEITAANMAREAECITPSWNITGEPDLLLMNSWQTWNEMDPLPNQDEFARGQLFSSLDELKRKIIIYSAARGKEYKVKKARDRWYTVVCTEKDKGCTWKLTAHQISENDSFWRISTYKGPHTPTCVRDLMHTDNRSINEKFISQEILSVIRVDKALKPRVIMEMIQKAYHVTITYRRAWGAKQKAIASIFGDWEESYAIVPRFLAAVVQWNPGTVVEWDTVPSNDGSGQIFVRVFWSFGPCIQGFQHCRPLISIDGTHLYGKYKEVLLIAMAVDANQQIFPLAYAIVESENGSSWSWFMDIIGRRVTQRTGLCVISDRHAGIIKTMKELPRWREPNAYHRFCVRHVVSNFMTAVKDQNLKRLLGSTAYRHEETAFDNGYSAICSKSAKGKDFLDKMAAHQWSLCHDGGLRYGVMTTNMSECFNGVMKGARSLPICGIVQSTFYKSNSYFVERLGMAKARIVEGHPFSDKVQQMIDQNLTLALHAQVIPFDISRHVYEVHVPQVEEYGSRVSYVVNLTQRTCTCQRWRNLRVACPHVLAVCRARGLSHVPFIDQFYTTESHMKTYQMAFYPVGDSSSWPVFDGPPLKPNPSQKRGKGKPGRRKESRYQNEMDITSVPGKVCCSVCGQHGHNKRSCASRASGSGH